MISEAATHRSIISHRDAGLPHVCLQHIPIPPSGISRCLHVRPKNKDCLLTHLGLTWLLHPGGLAPQGLHSGTSTRHPYHTQCLCPVSERPRNKKSLLLLLPSPLLRKGVLKHTVWKLALCEVTKEAVNRDLLLPGGSGEGFFGDFSGMKHKDQKWVEYGSNALTWSVWKPQGRNLLLCYCCRLHQLSEVRRNVV